MPEQSGEPVDFLAVLSLVQEYDVEQIELEINTGSHPNDRQGKDTYVSYSLGGGVTSFLELHSLREDINVNGSLYKAGNVVALKRSFVGQFLDDTGVSHRQYEFIQRELNVLCHPRLRSHENICDILFVGWEDHTPSPVLGLELGEYGTLKDFLFCHNLKEYGQMATHLVLDVAIGLEALHREEIVHGDVKTGNILVFHHPDRRVVAKLTDFADSMSTTDGRPWAPVGGTHAWRAPECYENLEYDRKATDVYSFGLCALAVLAQGIWVKSVNSKGVGDCFLVRNPQFEGKSNNEVVNETKAWKRDPSDMILNLALNWVEVGKNDDFSGEVAASIIHMTLLQDPSSRQQMSSVVKEIFRPIARKFDTVSHKTLRNRHPFFKKRILEAAEKVATPALNLTFPSITNILNNSAELRKADLLATLHEASNPKLPDQLSKYSAYRALKAAAQVAEAYAINFGTQRNFLTAAKWLAVSARAFNLDHMLYFSVIDDALNYASADAPNALLRLTWLITATAGGCTEAGKILRDLNSDAFNLAQRMTDQSGGILRLSRDPERAFEAKVGEIEDDNLSINHQFLPLGYTILHYAVAFGHMEAVEELIQNGADVNAIDWLGSGPLLLAAQGGKSRIVELLLSHGADPTVESAAGITPLHALVYFKDEEVEILAERMIKDPLQLTVISKSQGAVGLQNPWVVLEGTPLQWAARKGSEKLFKVLLGKHVGYQTSCLDLLEVIEILASTHQASLLELIIPRVAELQDRTHGLGSEELDNLLYSCTKRTTDLELMMLHRKKYEDAKTMTINVLLNAGADPFRGRTGGKILQDVVIGDDLETLQQILDWGKDKGIEPQSVLNDTTRFEGRDAFQRSIYCGSWRIFRFLADNDYVNTSFVSERGINAMHAAALRGEIRYIEVLLELGFDTYARSLNGMTPFESALYSRNFDVATRLLQSDACERKDLFATPNSEGNLLFGSVVAAGLTNYRHAVDMTTIAYLERFGSFSQVNNFHKGTTILELVAGLWPSVRPDYQEFDRSLLEWLLERAPPDIINMRGGQGLAPLHWMVLRGNSDAIATMLQNDHCDVNIEVAAPTPDAEAPLSVPGHTALNIAYEDRHNVPEFVRNGGERELRQWGLRIEAIIKLLKDAGGVLGRTTSWAQEMEASDIPNLNIVHPGDGIMTSLLGSILGSSIRIDEQSHTGVWPKRLSPPPDKETQRP
ncbi:MAG: hypothetical protein M4579_002077 [Chaenotheca gracillima]|nr:MAG: hypothetical protein M4579_002077 [Chaenotheca gracillima]